MIIGIGLFKFSKDSAPQARRLLLEHLELEKRQEGILEGYVASAVDDPSRLLIYTRWDSRESREAMHRMVRESPETARRYPDITRLMSHEPVFGTFEIVE